VTTHELQHNVAGDVVGTKPKPKRCKRHDVVEPCAYCNEIPEQEVQRLKEDT